MRGSAGRAVYQPTSWRAPVRGVLLVLSELRSGRADGQIGLPATSVRHSTGDAPAREERRGGEGSRARRAYQPSALRAKLQCLSLPCRLRPDIGRSTE